MQSSSELSKGPVKGKVVHQQPAGADTPQPKEAPHLEQFFAVT